MKLDYFTLLCPEPISLSIGTIKQPTLRDIGKITFTKFSIYQVYLRLTPREYYTLLGKEQDVSYWDMIPDEQRKEITLYDIIMMDNSLMLTYLEILNFFFVEKVVFRDNLFWIINMDANEELPDDISLDDDNIKGVINPVTFLDVLDILRQICCISSDDPLDTPKPKFKNKKAERLYEKMLKAREQENKKRAQKDFYNFSLPNIISATAAKNPGLNIINIWDTTLFQLYDQFGKAQNDDVHYMNTVRVAVWGDDKNQFDPSLWYKNNFDKQV